MNGGAVAPTRCNAPPALYEPWASSFFSEAKEVVGGYALCELETHEDAVALARNFMELHRIHRPEFEGKSEVRPLED